MGKELKAPKVTASEVAKASLNVVEVQETSKLDSIVLDTPAKQEFMRTLLAYKAQNPTKFAKKENAFIKKLKSL